jgi:hypothetical protein
VPLLLEPRDAVPPRAVGDVRLPAAAAFAAVAAAAAVHAVQPASCVTRSEYAGAATDRFHAAVAVVVDDVDRSVDGAALRLVATDCITTRPHEVTMH